jgi:hypothetical protein
MPHTLDVAKLKDVFDGIADNMERLSKWESGFFVSVYDQWERGRELSEKQLERLEEIWLKMP